MGGTVISGLSILAFPEAVSEDIVTEILKGALDKIQEAGGTLVGGHSMSLDHIIYGLSINGLVAKDQLKPNDQAKPNQKIILTKKIGTGIYSNVINDEGDQEDCKEVIQSMTFLNKTASEVARKYAVSALTDVTGFGLLGHLSEVLKASRISSEIHVDQIPLFKRTRELCLSHANGGMKRNNDFFGHHIRYYEATKTAANENILFDPQTSGGLLIFVDASEGDRLLAELHAKGITQAAIIGHTTSLEDALVKVYR